jgi:hypothetical protein
MNIDNITRTKSYRDNLSKSDFEHIYTDMYSINGSIVTGSIPFVNSAGVDKPLSLTIDKKMPFQKANGTTSNLSLII